MKQEHDSHKHFILPTRLALIIGGALLGLTVITVAVAGVDLGRFNFPIAMLVASVKATLVALFFMGLKYDRKENAVIFGTSFLFLAIFFGLTITDLFFRDKIALRDGFNSAVAQTSSKFKKPWEPNPELIAKGKDLFAAQCVACHGAGGKGDGVAAGSLIPKPRNLTLPDGWKVGRKPTEVFKTLKEGLSGTAMASFASLPPEDRWALVHFVLSIGPAAPQDTPQDFAKIGIDPTKEMASSGGASESPTISVDLAIERMSEGK